MKCRRVGCLNKSTHRGHCDVHQSTSTPANKRVRPDYHKLYNTAWWRRTRIHILNNSPLCVICKSYGYTTPAVDVDHIVDHKGDEELFYDGANLQALCRRCHSQKTNSTIK